MRFLDIGRAALYSHIVVFTEIWSEESRLVSAFDRGLSGKFAGVAPGGYAAAEECTGAK
jgi:hypothetical protein